MVTLTIYVKDQATGLPIAGAVFTATAEGGLQKSVTSDGNGKIVFTYPEEYGGTYNPWTLTKSGYTTVSGASLPPSDYTYTQYMSTLPKKRTTLTISADPTSIIKGQSVTLVCQLMDELGYAVVDRPIRIDMQRNGVLLGPVSGLRTDLSGRVSYSYTPTATGTYTIWASFTGDSEYEGCEEEYA